MGNILIVDDEKNTREGLAAALEDRHEVTTAANAEEAFNWLDADVFDVVLTDLRMAGKSGMSVIDRALKSPNRPLCIMMTAYGSVPTAVEAMKKGAFDFLTKPVNLEQLEIVIERGLKSEALEKENRNLHERLDQHFDFSSLIGGSGSLKDVLDKVKLVAPSRASVLIEGETGTGKELIAQALHQNSPRARKPFVAVHCAALATNLLESELFGHEKGAFTGANERRVGRFEAANGGTLFLDEIGEIESSIQVKLLRFLETHSFERLGSIKPVEVDVRLVCATNRNLEAMVAEGSFREDLFYRLNVVRLELPPLRERVTDIPLLLEHYTRRFAKENGVPPPRFSPAVHQILTEYQWPGNIRELRNFCENTVVLHPGGEISEFDLEPRFFKTDGPSHNPSPRVIEPPSLSVEENEKRLLRHALIQAKGNKTKAAQLMGISRRTLHRKLAQWPELEK